MSFINSAKAKAIEFIRECLARLASLDDPLSEAPSDNSFNSTKAAIASVIIAFVISLLLTILQRLFYGSWMPAYSLFASTVIMLWGFYFCFRNSASTNAVALKLGIPIGMTTGLLYGLMFASIISSVFYGAFIGYASVSIFLTMWRQSSIAIMANSENKNYTKTLDQTFAAAQKAVRDLGYKVDTLDKANGLIKFKTGMSWKSFAGQEMSVIMIDNGDGSVGVSVSGRPNQSGQTFYWGESGGIARKVLAKMDGMSDQAQENSRKDSASAGEGDAAESPYTAFTPHIKREVAPQADDRVIQQHETNTTPSEATTDNSFNSTEATIGGVIIAFVISLLLTILQRLFYGSWMPAYSLLASTVIMSWCFYFNFRNSDATNATALKLGIPIGMTTGLLYGLMFASIISSVFYGAFIGVASVSILLTMGRQSSIAMSVIATCCSFIAFHIIGFTGSHSPSMVKVDAEVAGNPQTSESNDTPEEVTFVLLATMKEKYQGKTITLSKCRFYEIDDYDIQYLPDVFLGSNGLTTRYNATEHSKWVGFHVWDRNEKLFDAFVRKDQYGDFVLGLERGDRVTLTGKVVEFPSTTRVGVICTEVKKAGWW